MQFNHFDIHSHLNLSPLKENETEVVARMREKGVGTITVGVDLDTSREAIALAEKYDFVWATVGLHPTDTVAEQFNFETYKKIAEHPRVVAIGECGLDYFRDQKEETKSRQKELFKQQIKLAALVKKPLMIHSRPSKDSMDAYEDALEILESYTPQAVNFHFFVGDLTIAKRIFKNGWTVSFDGPITFARDYDEVIRTAPIDSIMAETDAPFAAPVPHRGKICEQWMVIEIYKKIAEIRGEDPEIVRQAILNNIERVFKINTLQ